MSRPFPSRRFVRTFGFPEVRTDMADSSVTKVDGRTSPVGRDGQRYLAAGVRMSMRLWLDLAPGEKQPVRRDYETIGYVLRGRAELTLEGQTVRLEPGDSYVVPHGAEHSYRILETFSTVEATSPPAEVHGREQRDLH